MGRKAIEKRDNQLIINIDEIEREQQALMLTKSNDLIHAKFNASLFVQKLLNFSLASIAKQPNGRYPARCEWQTCGMRWICPDTAFIRQCRQRWNQY